MSGAASESKLLGNQPAKPRWQRAALAGGVILGVILTGSLALYQQSIKHRPPKIAETSVVVTNTANGAPKPLLDAPAGRDETTSGPVTAVLPAPAAKPAPVPVQPGPAASRPVPEIDPAAPRPYARGPKSAHSGDSCQRVEVTRPCIVKKAELSADVQQAIVDSASSTSLRVCRGQTLRMVREGNRMIIDSKGTATRSLPESFSGTLRALLSGRELPAEVTLKCTN